MGLRRLLHPFLIRSLGGDVDYSAVPYLGGVGAVGAIVAVVSVIAPSGLGVREASMYGLLLAVTTSSIALGATVLNRVAITLVEAALLLGRRPRGSFQETVKTSRGSQLRALWARLARKATQQEGVSIL